MFIDTENIPSHLLTEAVREIIREIHSVEQQCSKLAFEPVTFETQALQLEIEDLRADLELELELARTFRRGFGKKKTPPASPSE